VSFWPVLKEKEEKKCCVWPGHSFSRESAARECPGCHTQVTVLSFFLLLPGPTHRKGKELIGPGK
jgi:hypothetical protein